MEEKKDN